LVWWQGQASRIEGAKRQTGEERAIGRASQIHKDKEASERQPHPFCRNRRKDGPPRGVFGDPGAARPWKSLDLRDRKSET
jgi:hypothetical protein